MSVSNEQLIDLIAEASYRIHKEIKSAYKNGNLEDFLQKYNMADLLPKNNELDLFESNKDGKILIVGATRLKKAEMIGCAKKLGIDKRRLEIITEYEEIQKYSFGHTQYNPNYRLILVGPIPHSGISKGEKSSVLTEIEGKDGYPKVIRLRDSHGLKITKSGFTKVLSQEIDKGYLEIN